VVGPGHRQIDLDTVLLGSQAWEVEHRMPWAQAEVELPRVTRCFFELEQQGVVLREYRDVRLCRLF
jgi:hypothetical protein